MRACVRACVCLYGPICESLYMHLSQNRITLHNVVLRWYKINRLLSFKDTFRNLDNISTMVSYVMLINPPNSSQAKSNIILIY